MIAKKTNLNNRERAYSYIRQAILTGDINYQKRLVDNEIAVELGMSRMPVREALLQLRSEGFLDTTYRGFILKAYSAESIYNIFAVRLLLEPEAAYSACQVITDFQLRALQDACTEVKATDDAGLIADNLLANWRFRTAWAQAVLNVHLKETMDRLRDWAEQARLVALSDPAFRAETAGRVQGILEAFMAKDADLVKERVKENLILCRDRYCVIQEKLILEN